MHKSYYETVTIQFERCSIQENSTIHQWSIHSLMRWLKGLTEVQRKITLMGSNTMKWNALNVGEEQQGWGSSERPIHSQLNAL